MHVNNGQNSTSAEIMITIDTLAAEQKHPEASPSPLAALPIKCLTSRPRSIKTGKLTP
ncbi:MAG: hypothetical protein ACRBBR_15390 [Cellvibrionaceae bacterium]